MSYILDALRKSDQQRQRGVLPTLMAPQATEPVRGRGITIWHGVSVAALIGIGIAIGAFRPWHAEDAPPAAPVLASKRPDTSEAVAPPISQSTQKEAVARPAPSVPAPNALPATAPTPKPAPKVAASRTPVATAAKTGNKATPATRDLPAAAPEEALGPAQAPHSTPAAAEPASEQKVVAITDLPPSIRDEMPKMTITVHAYSREPKDRLVGINDRVLHEGESLSPGLKLEQITPDGLIMSYKGYRFHRGVR